MKTASGERSGQDDARVGIDEPEEVHLSEKWNDEHLRRNHQAGEYDPEHGLRPRKGTREIPKAARLASTTTITVMADDVRALLKYQRSMFPALSTSTKDSRVNPDGGIQLIGITVVSASVLSAVSTAQASGMSQMMAATSNTPNASQLPSLRRPVPAVFSWISPGVLPLSRSSGFPPPATG